MKLVFACVLTVFAILFSVVPARAAPKDCLFYEPGETTLKGFLRHTTAGWSLELDKSVCIEGKEGDRTGMYPTEDAVKTGLLIFHKEVSAENAYGGLVDKHVAVVGTLYHRFDNSPTQVMLNVSNMKDMSH